MAKIIITILFLCLYVCIGDRVIESDVGKMMNDHQHKVQGDNCRSLVHYSYICSLAWDGLEEVDHSISSISFRRCCEAANLVSKDCMRDHHQWYIYYLQQTCKYASVSCLRANRPSPLIIPSFPPSPTPEQPSPPHPNSVSPSPTPEQPSPIPQPHSVSPSPTPEQPSPPHLHSISPSPTPEQPSPIPQPHSVSPSPTLEQLSPPHPHSISPSPTPGQPSPIPQPHSASPSPTLEQSSPVPQPHSISPSPTPEQPSPISHPHLVSPSPTPEQSSPIPQPPSVSPPPTPEQPSPTPQPSPDQPPSSPPTPNHVIPIPRPNPLVPLPPSPSPSPSPPPPNHPIRPKNCLVAVVRYDSCNPRAPDTSHSLATPYEKQFIPSESGIAKIYAADCCVALSIIDNKCDHLIKDMSYTKLREFYRLEQACSLPYVQEART